MEFNTLSASTTPASQVRACTNCARAKAKCTLNPDHDTKCERCSRLNKDCQRSLAIRKRKSVKRASGTKIARLEEKLDGLASLLKSATQSKALLSEDFSEPVAQARPSLGSPQSLASNRGDERSYNLCATNLADQENERTAGSYSTIYTPPSPSTAVADALLTTTNQGFATRPSFEVEIPREFCPSVKEADEFLNVFRSRLANYLPSVIVPPSMTSQELRNDRPFLWLCIMAITTKSTEQQVGLGRAVRQIMGHKILVEGERNLDLLLGVLTFVGWGHSNLHNKPIVTNLVQIAIALLSDLGLNKPPPGEQSILMMNYDARGCPRPFSSKPRTIEERRAAIVCFSVSSIVSLYFQRIESLRWTPYMEECLHTLSENSGCINDVLLVQSVRLQLINERVSQASWNDGVVEEAGAMQAPLQFYLQALQAQLNQFKSDLPPEMVNNELLQLHIYSTELSIHELAVSRTPAPPKALDFCRLESLYASLESAKNWFERFMSVPPARLSDFPMSLYTQLAHCIIALYRISTFEDPDWNPTMVLKNWNLSHVLQQVADRMDEVKIAAGWDRETTEDRTIFHITAQKLLAMKSWWDSKATDDSMNPAMGWETNNDAYVDFFDDKWLQDILGPVDHQYESYMQ